MQTEFLPIDFDYLDIEGQTYLRIFGRNKKGKRLCILDAFNDYFYAITKTPEKLKSRVEKMKVDDQSPLKIEIQNKEFLGESVKALKIYTKSNKLTRKFSDKVKEISDEIKRRELDIQIVTKYLIEKQLTPLTWWKIEGEILNNSPELKGIDNILEVDTVIKTDKISQLEENSNSSKPKFKPKVLAYDIETSELEIGKGEISMISLTGENFKKVLTWKTNSKKKFVEHFKDEAEMLEAFVKQVKEYSPDFLVGYFSDGFDLPYLRTRAEKNKVKLSLGLDGSKPKFSRGIVLSGKIAGITLIDLFKFIQTAYSQYLQSETLSLNEVASELIGERKHDVEHIDFNKTEKLNKEQWEDFYEYNLQDSLITEKLFYKVWPDILEFSRVINEAPYAVTRNSMSQNVDNFILHNLHKFNEIAQRKPHHDEIGERRMRGKYEGAFVFRPIPGLYKNIGFFDFTSMYSSVIVSYNLSLSTLTKDKKKSHKAELDPPAYFQKTPKGFFPTLLEDIIEKRKKYKKEYQKNPSNLLKARSNAFKLIANAAYGYQGFFGARYYCLEAAAATAYFARKHIQQTIEEIEKDKFKVIYGDSVSGNTKIIIKKDNKIYEEEIQNIFKKTDSKSSLGKEYNLKKDIEVLTLDKDGNSVFKSIVYVMKHKCNKQMYKINFTNNWSIDATEDHSLMGYQSSKHNQSKKVKENPINRIIEVKPEEIKKKINSIICLKKIPFIKTTSKNYPKKVYEFMGFFIGDGAFHRNKSHQKANKDYYLGLSLGNDNKEVFKKLILPLKKLDYIKNHWWSKTRPGDIRFNGLKLIKIISENCRKNNKKIIPKWLFEEKEENIQAFLRGLFSADGCVMIRNNAPIIKYTSINKDYIKEVRRLLYRTGISHSVFKENTPNKYKTKIKTYSTGSFSKNIIIKNKEDFAKKIGFIIERKNKRANIKTNGTQKKLIKNFEFDLQGVKSIENISTPKYVYDLEVEDTHTFFANYILAHNTDSVAFILNKKTKKQAEETLKKINSKLPGVMELESEGFFKRGIWVTKRTGEFGAKKKYALIDNQNNLKIRGFETVRRDWCQLARKTQSKILQMILEDGDDKKSLEYIKSIIKKIKAREIPLKELIIKTQLKKPIEEYKNEGPHVTIAKRMRKAGVPIDIGMVIQYYISEPENGKKRSLIRERAKLLDEKGKYDIDYYLNNQILPSVENIFEVFKIKTKELVDGKKQMSLGEF